MQLLHLRLKCAAEHRLRRSIASSEILESASSLSLSLSVADKKRFDSKLLHIACSQENDTSSQAN